MTTAKLLFVLLCAAATLPCPTHARPLPAFAGTALPARAAPSLRGAALSWRPKLRDPPGSRGTLPALLRRDRATPHPLWTHASVEGAAGGPSAGMPTYESMVEAAGGEWEGVFGMFNVDGALISEGRCETRGSMDGSLLSLVTTNKDDGSAVMSNTPPDDLGVSCAVFEGGGFSLGPGRIRKDESFEIVHCLPYGGDERIRIMHTYNNTGRLQGMRLVHEVRKGTFDASKLAPFAGAPTHSNVCIAGVWKGTNMRVDISDGVPAVSFGEIQKFYQSSSGGSGLFQCLPLGISSVAPPLYREGVSFYVGVGWTPAVSCGGDKCKDARPVAVRTYAKDGTLASVAQRIERRQVAGGSGVPPVAAAGGGRVDDAVAASAVAGYDIARKMDEEEKARVKKWQEGAASQASGAGGQALVGGAMPKEEEEEEEQSELMKAIKSKDESLRMATVIGCKDIPTDEAAPILWHVFDSNETDPAIREFAALALGFKPNNRSYEILTALVENEDHDEVRAAAAAGLGYLADPRAFDTLKMLLYEDHYSRARASAAVSLGMLRDVRSLDALIDGLSQDGVGVYDMVRACIGALGELGDVRAVKHILKFSKCDDFVTQQILAEALGNLACPEAEEALKFLQNEDHPNVQKAATMAREQIAARMLQRK